MRHDPQFTVALDPLQDAMKREWMSHEDKILCESFLRCCVRIVLPISGQVCRRPARAANTRRKLERKQVDESRLAGDS